MTKHELKPCPNPRCRALEPRYESAQFAGGFCWIECPACHMRGPTALDYDEAGKLWNDLPRSGGWHTTEPDRWMTDRMLRYLEDENGGT